MVARVLDPGLTAEDAVRKRDELIRDGFCVVPGVLQGAMLDKVRDFVAQFLDSHLVDPKFRYQGSDHHIMAERVWSERKEPQRHHSPVVDELLDLAPVQVACEAVGLEGMRADGSIIILNKPAHGPALYWHQDNMQWNHPKSALPCVAKVHK